MGDSDMSPKARVTYDQHKFQVEFNVSEYLPEVREAKSFFRLLQLASLSLGAKLQLEALYWS